MLSLTYASGLGVGEVLQLRVKDIDSKRMLITGREDQLTRASDTPFVEAFLRYASVGGKNRHKIYSAAARSCKY